MRRSFWELLLTYLRRDWQRVLNLTVEHVAISAVALGITIVVCVPLGIFITRRENRASFVIGLAKVFLTIPSLALLGFLIFVFGIGNDNAIAALFLYAMLPVLQNTYTGIKNLPKRVTDAARGMGMTEFQIMMRVEVPLALPVIIGGLRVAAVWIIGTAALAAAIGGGGLGRLIFSGLSAIRNEVIVAGAVPATLLALGADYGLRAVQNHLSPDTRARRIAARERRTAGA